MCRMTEAELAVLNYADYFDLTGRDQLVAERPGVPHTIGIRAAFDRLVADGFLVAETTYVLSDSGRAALHAEGE